MAEIGRLTGNEAHLVVTAQVLFLDTGKEGLTKESPIIEVQQAMADRIIRTGTGMRQAEELLDRQEQNEELTGRRTGDGRNFRLGRDKEHKLKIWKAGGQARRQTEELAGRGTGGN